MKFSVHYTIDDNEYSQTFYTLDDAVRLSCSLSDQVFATSQIIGAEGAPIGMRSEETKVAELARQIRDESATPEITKMLRRFRYPRY